MIMCRLCISAFWIHRRKLTVQTVIPTFFSVKALKNREGIDRLKGLGCPIYHFIWHYMITEDTFNPWEEERSCHRVKAIYYTHKKHCFHSFPYNWLKNATSVLFLYLINRVPSKCIFFCFILQRTDTPKTDLFVFLVLKSHDKMLL